MVEAAPFAAMRGMDVLIFVRDALADEAALKRSFIAASERYGGGTTDPAIRQRMAALDAAADGLTFVIGIGQDEKISCAANSQRRFPEWITRLCSQMRYALIEPDPDTAEKETAGS
jgi:hypothetical protein